MLAEERSAARAALHASAHHWCKKRWAAGWLIGLKHALVPLTDEHTAGAFRWLVERAGGLWTRDATQLDQLFGEGTYSEGRRPITEREA